MDDNDGFADGFQEMEEDEFADNESEDDMPSKKKGKKKKSKGLEGFADYQEFAHLLEQGVEDEQDKKKQTKFTKKRHQNFMKPQKRQGGYKR